MTVNDLRGVNTERANQHLTPLKWSEGDVAVLSYDSPRYGDDVLPDELPDTLDVMMEDGVVVQFERSDIRLDYILDNPVIYQCDDMLLVIRNHYPLD